MGSIQTYIDNVVPADFQGNLLDAPALLTMYAMGKALEERNITASNWNEHDREVFLQPGSGKVTAWNGATAYQPLDVVSHGGSRYLCRFANTNVTPVDAVEEMECQLVNTVETIDVITELTIPGGIDIQKTGDTFDLDNTIDVFDTSGNPARVTYVVNSVTEIEITALNPGASIKIQKLSAWRLVSIDDELRYLYNFKNWITEYQANLNKLVGRSAFVDNSLAPVVLDAFPVDSDGYIKTKVDWLVTQIQKMNWHERPFATWFRTYQSGAYVQSTAYINGIYTGSDTVSYDQGDIFRAGGLFQSGGSIVYGVNSVTLNNLTTGTSYTRPRDSWGAQGLLHNGQDFVRDFDIQFDITGEGRVQVGELYCDFTSNSTKLWWPEEPDRDEQNRHYYYIDATLTSFQAVFSGGVLTVTINGIQALTMKTDFVAIRDGRYNDLDDNFNCPWEVSTAQGETCTVSNMTFSRPDENLTQVQHRYEYVEFTWTQNYSYSSYTYSPGYTYFYPIDTNVLNIPTTALGTPTVDTGDLVIRPFRNGPFGGYYFDPPAPHTETVQILTFKTLIKCLFLPRSVDGYEPPFSAEHDGMTFTFLQHFPIAYPKCPNSYTAVVYAKAKNTTNSNGSYGGYSDSIEVVGDETFDWGITNILTQWVELARVAVPADTKGSIDISNNWVFPAQLDAVSMTFDDSRDYAVYHLENEFDVKLIMEMNHDYN